MAAENSPDLFLKDVNGKGVIHAVVTGRMRLTGCMALKNLAIAQGPVAV